MVNNHLQDVLNAIENLIDSYNYYGCIKQYFDLVKKCSKNRPEHSVLKLIKYLSEFIHPMEHKWLEKLHELIVKFYNNDTRTVVRQRAIEVLTKTYNNHHEIYEAELLDRIVLPAFLTVHHDKDPSVRCAVAEFLIEAALNCEKSQCLDLLSILGKLLSRPFDQQSDTIPTNADLADVNIVAGGLIKILYHKIHLLPSIHAVKIFKILVYHLEQHYKRPYIFVNYNLVRFKVT